jgi:hypothetical protein
MTVTQATSTDTTTQAIVLPDHVRLIMFAVRDNLITDETGSYLPYGVSTRNLNGFQIDVIKPNDRIPFTMTISVVGHELSMTCHYDTVEELQNGITYATTRNVLNSFLEQSIAGMQATIAKLARIAMNIE